MSNEFFKTNQDENQPEPGCDRPDSGRGQTQSGMKLIFQKPPKPEDKDTPNPMLYLFA